MKKIIKVICTVVVVSLFLELLPNKYVVAEEVASNYKEVYEEVPIENNSTENEEDEVATEVSETFEQEKAGSYDENEDSRVKIQRALSWVKTKKNEDGTWGNSDTALFYTSEIIGIKEYINSELDFSKLQQSLKTESSSSDYKSRELAFYEGQQNEERINQLSQYQNEDGGFGGEKGFDSNIWDTLVVCKNLILYENQCKDKIDNSIVYILSNQNKDGGWSYLKDEESDVFLTSQVILLFYSYMQEYKVSPKVLIESSQTASNFLIKMKDDENYWGLENTNLKSSIETFRALVKTQGISSQKDFIEKLKSLQESDGSYCNDIYTTILAIKALNDVDTLTRDEINEIEFINYVDTDSNGIPRYDGFSRVIIKPQYKLHEENEVELSIFIEDKDGKSILTNEKDGLYYYDLDNSIAGDYKVIAQVKEKESGNVTASMEKNFIVNKYVKIESGYTTLDPYRLQVGENKEISNYVNLRYKCNYDVDVAVNTSIRSSINSKDEQFNGEITLNHNLSEAAFKIISFNPQTSEKNYYNVKNIFLIENKNVLEDEVKLNIVSKPPVYTPEVTSTVLKQWLNSASDETEVKFNIFGGNSDVTECKGTDLMILIDNSPSMYYEDRIKEAKEAAKTAISLLGENDRVGVIKFSKTATCLTIEKDPITKAENAFLSDKEIAKRSVDKIETAEYSTSIYAGVKEANKRFENVNDNKRKQVLIIADGDENVSTVENILQEVKTGHDNEIIYNCIGIGTDLENEEEGGTLQTTLKSITSKGEGIYGKAPTTEQLKDLMLDISGQIINLSARNLKLVAKLNEKYMRCGTDTLAKDETIDGKRYLSWDIEKLKCNEKKEFSLHFSGENMPDNTEINLFDEVYLEYLDNQGTRKRVNIQVPSIWVSDYNFVDDISLDKDRYVSKEDVNITGVGHSLSKKEGNYNLTYTITDINGTVIEKLGEEKVFFNEEISNEYSFKWNTQKFTAGKYYFNVNYYNNDVFICTNKKEINIQKDGVTTVNTYTDKSEYKPNENIKLSTVINNTSNNFIEKNLKLNIYIKDSKGNVIWEKKNCDLPEINAYSTIKLENNFNIGNNLSGNYEVISEITRDGQVVNSRKNEFSVISSSLQGDGVIGTIALNKHELSLGESLDVNYSIINSGNVDINNRNVYIEILDSDGKTIKKIMNNNINLNKGQTLTDKILWNNDIEDGGLYIIGLYMDLQNSGGTVDKKLISSEIFNVSVPCKVLIEERNEWSQWIQSNTLYPQFRITNEFSKDLDLSKFKIRYYYTSEGISDDLFLCDWATNGRENIEGNIIKIPNSNKRILEISFKENAGVIKPGEFIELQTRVLKQSWNDSFNQSDDYSFNKDSQVFKRWDNVNAYFQDSKVWGIEPKDY